MNEKNDDLDRMAAYDNVIIRAAATQILGWEIKTGRLDEEYFTDEKSDSIGLVIQHSLESIANYLIKKIAIQNKTRINIEYHPNGVNNLPNSGTKWICWFRDDDEPWGEDSDQYRAVVMAAIRFKRIDVKLESPHGTSVLDHESGLWKFTPSDLITL